MSRPTPLPIPISSLLVSTSPTPSSFASVSTSTNVSSPASISYLSPSTYIVGPLPPTSPLHLALNYLGLADHLPYSPLNAPRHAQEAVGELAKGKGKGKGKERAAENTSQANNQVAETTTNDGNGTKQLSREIRARERVLIITGPKGEYADKIQEEDEDVFRSISGEWETLKMLKRVDIRYCPSPKHLQLLLTLLTESDSRFDNNSNQNLSHAHSHPHHVESTPSLIILWDVASMFMVQQTVDENEPPPNMTPSVNANANATVKHGKRFKSDARLSDYMDLLSATKATVDHLNTLHPSYEHVDPPTQLIILEPSLNALSSLPILPPITSENEDPKMPKSARERKVPVIDGARWLFGKASIGIIHQLSGEANVSTSYYTLTFERDGNTSYQMRKKKCSKAPHSVAEYEGSLDGPTGWRWDWVTP
uniref:Uncharacterized protein n=1 Tax=Kwoniella dejecticola CBS 10117 TaxID=1296121 RepID=A0A1A6A5B4_9TREE|nr:uncharacterized protein I303_04585 [Kwoniella dejecticola CBS 10117]OBR85252.1 hypothetical protein I303_04585 [Kwoniella dejecticola CBS 10117]